jgi:hypothetical protein
MAATKNGKITKINALGAGGKVTDLTDLTLVSGVNSMTFSARDGGNNVMFEFRSASGVFIYQDWSSDGSDYNVRFILASPTLFRFLGSAGLVFSFERPVTFTSSVSFVAGSIATPALASANLVGIGGLTVGNGESIRKNASSGVWEAFTPSAGGGGGGLQPGNNLSDLTNITTARSNLGLGSAALSEVGDFATASQGALAATALQPGTAIGNISGLQGALDARIISPTPVADRQILTSSGGVWISANLSSLQVRDSIVSDTAPVSPLVGQQWHESSGNASALVHSFPWTWTGTRWGSPIMTRDLNAPGATLTVAARASGAAARSNVLIGALSAFSAVKGGTAYDVFVDEFFGHVFTNLANSSSRFLIFQLTLRNNANTVSNLGASSTSQTWTTTGRWNPINVAINSTLTSSTTNPIIFATAINITEPLESAAVASWTYVLSLCVTYRLLRK